MKRPNFWASLGDFWAREPSLQSNITDFDVLSVLGNSNDDNFHKCWKHMITYANARDLYLSFCGHFRDN